MVVVAAVVVVVVRSMVVRNPVAVMVLLVLPSQALRSNTHSVTGRATTTPRRQCSLDRMVACPLIGRQNAVWQSKSVMQSKTFVLHHPTPDGPTRPGGYRGSSDRPGHPGNVAGDHSGRFCGWVGAKW